MFNLNNNHHNHLEPLIIAEAGVNHNGCLARAKKMVEIAADAGADYIKFQTFKTENLVTKNANCADYQQQNIKNTTKSQFAMLKELELTFSEFEKLAQYCQKLNIGFLSTAFDLECLQFLLQFDLDYLKIPSGEITNYPYLREHSLTEKPLIMSTGMASLTEVEDAVNILKKYDAKITERLTLLHCTTEYPAPIGELNLQAIQSLKNYFRCNVGYSDHSNGIHIPLIATMLGAVIIEKHFTLDKNLIGPDHKASLDGSELKKMIINIRDINKALGSGEKVIANAEFKNRKIARKSIVAKYCITKNDIFSEDNLTVKRVDCEGISPLEWQNLIGKNASKNFIEDEAISL